MSLIRSSLNDRCSGRFPASFPAARIQVTLPIFVLNGGIVMLTSYFDDSGTHGTSDVVVLGGLIANQYQWKYFSDLWSKKLKEPSPGKSPLARFHMTECQSGAGEFAGWGRTATDFLVHELGDIILKTGLWSFGCAVPRKDWDELVTGEARVAGGDAEGACLRSCYVGAKHLSERVCDPDMAFVFDDRPHRSEENKRVFALFQSLAFKYSSLTFASSRRVLPLQAADLIAWEMYQHSLAIVNGTVPRIDEFYRKQFARIARSGRCWFKFAKRTDIPKMLNSPYDAIWRSRAAQYFATGHMPTLSDEEVYKLLKEEDIELPDFPKKPRAS